MKNRENLRRTEETDPGSSDTGCGEDLYRPYRPKRRTRAIIAKEKGLEPLADIIILQMTGNLWKKEAEAYVNPKKKKSKICKRSH